MNREFYFPFHVLDDPDTRRQQRDSVRWDRVEKVRGFGGVRIDDTVLIRDDGSEYYRVRFRRSELRRLAAEPNRVEPMYLPKVFEEQNPERLRDFVRRYPLGTVVIATTSGLDANHIPLVIAETEGAAPRLHGHIARANPLWREVGPNAETLVIFHGPNGYVSPSWYTGQCDRESVVPTWNYAVVHGHGRLRFIDDAAWVRAHVEALTQQHEAARDNPWAVTDAPAEFIDKLVTAVVGVEISVTRWHGKWKVSQNRSAVDRVGVIEGLQREASASSVALAALVKEPLARAEFIPRDRPPRRRRPR